LWGKTALAQKLAPLAETEQNFQRYNNASAGAIGRPDTRATAARLPEAVIVAQANINSAAADVQRVPHTLAQQQTQLGQIAVRAPAGGLVAGSNRQSELMLQIRTQLFSKLSKMALWNCKLKYTATELPQVKLMPALITYDADPRVHTGRVREISTRLILKAAKAAVLTSTNYPCCEQGCSRRQHYNNNGSRVNSSGKGSLLSRMVVQLYSC